MEMSVRIFTKILPVLVELLMGFLLHFRKSHSELNVLNEYQFMLILQKMTDLRKQNSMEDFPGPVLSSKLELSRIKTHSA